MSTNNFLFWKNHYRLGSPPLKSLHAWLSSVNSDYICFALFLPGFQRSKYPLFESLSNFNKQFTSLKNLINHDCNYWNFLPWIFCHYFCFTLSLPSFQRRKYSMFELLSSSRNIILLRIQCVDSLHSQLSEKLSPAASHTSLSCCGLTSTQMGRSPRLANVPLRLTVEKEPSKSFLTTDFSY